MRLTYVKYITALGLVAILLLQTIWLFNTYMYVESEIKEKCLEALDASIEEETWSRLDNAFKEKKVVKIEGGSVRGNQNLHLQEELLKLEMPISMQVLDSIYNVELQKLNLQTEVLLKHVSTKPHSLIQASAPLRKMSWGAITTEIIPVRLDGSEGIQAVLLNPYEMIFTRLGLILIATVLIMLFVSGCIAYQIKIILFQNKLAKLKNDFSHAMVHDMKTPLTTIMMGLHTLHSGKLDTKPEKKEKNFTIVEEEAQHLLTLVNEILTISKLESGKLELSKQSVPIGEVINDLVGKAQAHADKPIRFELDIRQETVIADPVYIKEAIANLIDNAIKYSKETVLITITVYEKDSDVLIVVKDDGIGISHKDYKKIFEKFERTSAVIERTRKGGAAGFGLGLNYVHQVVEAHGGRVWVESIEDEFSEFTLYLPQQI